MTDNDSPIVVEPIEAQIDIDSAIVVEPVEAPSDTDLHYKAKNKNEICCISFKKELQGLVIIDREIESCYCDIHTALLNSHPMWYNNCLK